ncbi:uncharacterized protein LOC128884196 isoform X2 [Hylaeus volcanicus]|nr:uncharacterized protein LOC128884196 isoform X2 [Hylaeus volcanicus]
MELKFQSNNPLNTNASSNFLTMGERSKTCKTTFCSKCSSQHLLTATVEPVTQQEAILARYDTKGFRVSSVMPFDIYTECGSCSQSLLCQNVLARVCRKIQCSSCFRTSHFFFESIHVDDAIPCPILPRHFKQHSKIKPEVLSIKINTPLPLNGACQHYKKSFRWLRFPCCGKVFPCDLCHNANTDHKCEWANRMICGHCSREQQYSNKPCVCGGSLQQGKSSHWEGGKGCRNTVLMNRHDSKKYKGLTKTKPKP